VQGFLGKLCAATTIRLWLYAPLVLSGQSDGARACVHASNNRQSVERVHVCIVPTTVNQMERVHVCIVSTTVNQMERVHVCIVPTTVNQPASNTHPVLEYRSLHTHTKGKRRSAPWNCAPNPPPLDAKEITLNLPQSCRCRGCSYVSTRFCWLFSVRT
jgi:hypothetical protein